MPKHKQKTPTPDQLLERAVEETMLKIDEHYFSGSNVPQQVTIDFLNSIISACQMRIEVIREEMSK